MKEILIDIYKIKDLYSGLGQFSYNFTKEIISQKNTDFNVSFLTPKNFNLIDNSNHEFIIANTQKRYFPSLNKKFDIWHSLHQFPSHMPNKNSKHILTVHDLNFLIEKNEAKAAKYLKILQKNIDKADVITTISNYTKNILEQNIDLKGKAIQTIYNGVELKCFDKAKKPDFVGDNKFFFTISVFKENKNFDVLLPLMKQFKDFKLVIAGNNETAYGERIKKKIKDLNLTNRVILPGKISAEDKYWLYNNCEAFMFPSLCEGFGLPVIEAMKLGKPVFLSTHTCLPEIGGDKAYYFKNFEEDYMVDLIKTNLSNFDKNKAELSEEIIKHANKFSWETCINQYTQLYIEILNNYTYNISK